MKVQTKTTTYNIYKQGNHWLVKGSDGSEYFVIKGGLENVVLDLVKQTCKEAEAQLGADK